MSPLMPHIHEEVERELSEAEHGSCDHGELARNIHRKLASQGVTFNQNPNVI